MPQKSDKPISHPTDAKQPVKKIPLANSSPTNFAPSLPSKENYCANQIRNNLVANHIFTLNLISSPGSGKTTLLTKVIKRLKEQHKIYVIAGDQQTDIDTTRIEETGVQVVQVNTGSTSHLQAGMINQACSRLNMDSNSFLFIENVGNLICPAQYDLGESHKIVVLSVTEGEDKPLKYPAIFQAADLLIINKIDLLPHVNFNLQTCSKYAQQVNPNIEIIALSAMTCKNIPLLCKWLIAAKNAD